jgi:hypothetical protein
MRSTRLIALVLALCPFAARASVSLSVAPSFASIHTAGTQRFTASLTGGSDSGSVAWQVDGIPGGNATVGTISAAGLYTAPAKVPATTTVTVTAMATGAEPVNITVAVTTGISFYVSPAGKDTNPGTLAQPWKTLQHAANTALAGDSVYARNGTYSESVSLPRSGSAAAGSIVFQSYPGELATLDGTHVACCGDSIQGLFNLLANNSYIILAGFQIQNYHSNNVNNEPAAIYISGSGAYIHILNNTIHGITETAGKNGNAHGIGVYGTSINPLAYVTVSGNDVYGLETGNSETIIFDGNVTQFTVTGNYVHDTNNIGIDATGFYQTGPAGHDQAHNGYIAGNTVANITSVHNPAYNGYGADGIYCDGCTEVVIERNLVYNCDLNIEAASENYGHDTSYVTIRDNVVYGGNLAGISFGGYAGNVGGSDHITVVNNTLFNNNRAGQGGDFQIQYHATSNVFENNIVYSGSQGLMVNGVVDSTSSPVTADHNLYFTTAKPQWWYQDKEYTTFAAYQGASSQDKDSHFENPGLISIASPYNFDLTASSPARNTGNYALGASDYGALDFAGNPRTTGKTINIGAYQQ